LWSKPHIHRRFFCCVYCICSLGGGPNGGSLEHFEIFVHDVGLPLAPPGGAPVALTGHRLLEREVASLLREYAAVVAPEPSSVGVVLLRKPATSPHFVLVMAYVGFSAWRPVELVEVALVFVGERAP